MIAKQKTSGFALPTVLIVSVIMLIVLLAALTAASSVRSGIDSQYYEQLAREGAEAGIARAQGCLQQSATVPTWSDAKPLTPWTDCSGNALTTETCPSGTNATNTKAACSVLLTSTLRTSFSVGLPTTSSSGVQLIVATGYSYVLRTTDTSISRTYTASQSASVGSNVAITYTNISNAGPNSFGLGNPLAADSFSFGADGNVYGLGYNGFGILGNGSTANATKPAKFMLPGNLKASSVGVNGLSGGMSAFVITVDGQVYGAGANNFGQLGNGSTSSYQSTPVKFNLPAGKFASTMFVHGESTFVICTDGTVYGAGAGTYGQLGNGAATNSSTPVQMILPAGEKATQIQADWHSVYIVTQSGKAYFTGINDWGQSGNGTLGGQINTPVRFYPNAGDAGEPTVLQVVTDGNTGWIRLSDGSVWGVGRSGDGQLGNASATTGATGYYTLAYTKFNLGSERAVQIATDYVDIGILTATGKVIGGGRNDSGELGCGTTGPTYATPCQMQLPSGAVGSAIVVTGDGQTGASDRYIDNTLVLTTDGRAYAVGDNNYGQLGTGASGAAQSTPKLMILPSGIQARSVRAGAGTSVILGSDNKVYGTGNNNYGQLGTGNTTNLSTPTATTYLNQRPSVLY